MIDWLRGQRLGREPEERFMNSSTLVATLAITSLAPITFAGDVNPPPGPVDGTMKTLDEVRPSTPMNVDTTPGDANSTFRITAPGAYHLTTNLIGESGKSGIEITSDDVTINLNGFLMEGVEGSLDGITTDDTPQSLDEYDRIVISNGAIAGWDGRGVLLNGVNHRVSFVSVQHCGNVGIFVGENAQVTDCNVSDNGLTGIAAGFNSLVARCVSKDNAGAGITCGFGQFTEDGGSILDCNASGNISGISIGRGGTITRCSVSFNGNAGITIGEGATLTESNVDRNGTGIVARSGSLIDGCSVYANLGDGIDAENARGVSILDCAVKSNQGHGILIGASNVVRGNICESNAETGIRAEFIGIGNAGLNRISGNTCITNDVGISIGTTDNLITGNACSGNSVFNWSLIPGNAVAPIVSVTTNIGGINGDTYAGPFGATDSLTNITY
jgi:parallel beta-helix repeat protein